MDVLHYACAISLRGEAFSIERAMPVDRPLANRALLFRDAHSLRVRGRARGDRLNDCIYSMISRAWTGCVRTRVDRTDVGATRTAIGAQTSFRDQLPR